jgi:glyoxylase-like metal-dependent hydrolase (beta-lactamase superfamily II)
MILETVIVGSWEVNCYILASERCFSCVIIDPGSQEGKIREMLNKHKLTPGIVINTHGHADHIGCDDRFGVPVYIHSQDAALLKDATLNLSTFLMTPVAIKSEIRTVEDKSTIRLGDIELKVIHLPGHTPGGIALHLKSPQDKIVFTGDSLFCHSIGRTDLLGSSGHLLIRSIIDKLFILPDETLVYPGHGPSSSIGREKRENPFLS